jgi:DNA polymerase-3 subunit delta'
MGFEQLLGNERLKDNLTASLSRGHISHCYLISGPRGSGKHTLARLLAAAILCKNPYRPCLSCNPCRKVMEGIHPDFITVEDPEHKTVAVKIVRQMRDDVFIRPNESDYKIYLFPQELGIEGQNALLKILEEPPKHGVFLLLTDNPEKILPTVRSRCTELKLQGLSRKELHRQLRQDFPQTAEEDLEAAILRSGGFLGQAREILEAGDDLPPQTEGFIRGFSGRDGLELARTLAPMEKWKRDQLIDILQSWLELSELALAARTGGSPAPSLARSLSESRSSLELMGLIRHLSKALDYTRSNVSPAAVCGYLSWALRGSYD